MVAEEFTLQQIGDRGKARKSGRKRETFTRPHTLVIYFAPVLVGTLPNVAPQVVEVVPARVVSIAADIPRAHKGPLGGTANAGRLQ